nr:F-box domain, leucine-rich repeat domain, L domain-like protein [Tanacetum cinerariifolium]
EIAVPDNVGQKEMHEEEDLIVDELAKSTNNSRWTTSAHTTPNTRQDSLSRNEVVRQGEIRLERADMGKEVVVGNPKCFNRRKQGQYSRNRSTRKIRNKTYFIGKMLLAAKEEQGQAFTADEHDFLVYTDDEGEQLEVNEMFLARLEKMNFFETEHADVAEAS